MNECNMDFVGVYIDDTIEIAIVSDDDGDYNVKTGAMTTASIFNTTAYDIY
jgi:hypothetical protein